MVRAASLFRIAVLGVTASGILPSTATAQDLWPARAVRFVVPSSPGGGTDVTARLFAQALGEQLKQTFVVDNRPGASGNIGADAAAKAVPDGYTFLVSANASIVIGPHLFKKLPFDVERDLVAVARGVTSPIVLVAAPALGAKTLADLVNQGKRDPGRIPFGSAGAGTPTYLTIRMLEESANVEFLHVPYKGMGAAMQDFLGGQVRFMLPDFASVSAHIKSGKAIPLAVTEKSRWLPGVPTFAEAGYPAVESIASFGVLAPAATPKPIVDRLSAELMRVMRSPTVVEKLDAQGLSPVFDTPAEAATSFKRERDLWGAFIRRNNITVD